MNRIIRYAAAATFAISMPALATMPPWDYRIKLTKHTGDLDISAHAFVGPAVTVGLENRSAKTVRCTASFVAYPHAPSRDEMLSAKIGAGKRATLAYPLEKLGANISTAFVDLNCTE